MLISKKMTTIMIKIKIRKIILNEMINVLKTLNNAVEALLLKRKLKKIKRKFLKFLMLYKI